MISARRAVFSLIIISSALIFLGRRGVDRTTRSPVNSISFDIHHPKPVTPARMRSGKAAPGIGPIDEAATAQNADEASFESVDSAHSLAWARRFESSRTNIFRDDEQLIGMFIAQVDDAVGELLRLLEQTPSGDVDVQHLRRSPPQQVKDRMAAVDLLEAVAHAGVTDESVIGAKRALGSIVTQRLPTGLSRVAKAIMVGEKYDALVSLTRVDPDLGFAVYGQLTTQKQRDVLAPALKTALADRGIERSQISAEFARLAKHVSSATQ